MEPNDEQHDEQHDEKWAGRHAEFAEMAEGLREVPDGPEYEAYRAEYQDWQAFLRERAALAARKARAQRAEVERAARVLVAAAHEASWQAFLIARGIPAGGDDYVPAAHRVRALGHATAAFALLEGAFFDVVKQANAGHPDQRDQSGSQEGDREWTA